MQKMSESQARQKAEQLAASPAGYGFDAEFWFKLLTVAGPIAYQLVQKILELLKTDPAFKAAADAAGDDTCSPELKAALESACHNACHTCCDVHCAAHLAGCLDH
jgi:hypothetical protein